MARKRRTAKCVSLGDVLSVLSTSPYWQFNSKFRMGDEFRVTAVDIPNMDYGGYPIITATCIHKGTIENDLVKNRIELGETVVFTASMPVYAHLRVEGQAPIGYCAKPDVSVLLAEKDKEIAELRRALYKACANWAKCEELISNRDAYDASEYLPSAENKFRKKAERWSEMESKCRAKAEGYK